MNSKRRKALLVLVAVIMAMGMQTVPGEKILGADNRVYGDTMVVSADVIGDPSAMQGDKSVVVTFEIENKQSGTFTFDGAELSVSGNDVTIKGSPTGSNSLNQGQTSNISFYLDVGKNAETGGHTMYLTLKNGSTTVFYGSVGNFTIYEKLATTGSGGSVAAADISQTIKPAGGFASGQDNTLSLEVFNNGNTAIKNAELTLTLPDGLSINNASNSASFGFISIGSKRTASFPITVDDDAASKNYGITAELTGLNSGNSAVSIKKTFYVPVNGSGSSLKNAAITNINIPNQVIGGDDFTLTFDVQNQNKGALKNVKVNVEVPEGLLNKTKSTFVESSIPAASSKNYSVTLFAADGAKEKSYPIKIALSSSTAKDAAEEVLQYASVYVNGANGEKTPQLMVDSYSYGGTYVQAGDSFLLDLGLYNTSNTHAISNIKVTVSSEDGTLIPVNSSNSFFIDKLAKKAHTQQSLRLAVKPAAEQKTTSLTVDMAYEDGAGNAFTSKDIISIPVMQETRLSVDDIVAPPELYPGMQTGLSVQFYNRGKTTLNNLRVNAEGNFDTQESTSYYVGNMESGKSDSYDFSFIPRQAGTMEGKLTFTYEDASGNEQVLEKPFSFQVMEEMPAPDDGAPPDQQGGKTKERLPWIIGGGAVSLAVVGIIVFKKLRKRKKIREMEIDE